MNGGWIDSDDGQVSDGMVRAWALFFYLFPFSDLFFSSLLISFQFFFFLYFRFGIWF
jgi:hypothetical protein